MDSSWSLSFNIYLGMVNVIGIDRIVFTTDYPFGNIKEHVPSRVEFW